MSPRRGSLAGILAIHAAILVSLIQLAGGPVASAIAQPRAPKGRVLSATGQPVVGADVLVRGIGATVRTDPDGWFPWPGPANGSWTIDIRAVGFLPKAFQVVVSAAEITPGRFALDEAAQQLPTLSVQERPVAARLAEFERRRRVGVGRFFTREDVAKTQAMSVSSLIRMLPAGVGVLDSAGTPLAVSKRGRKLVNDLGTYYIVPCVLRVAIDGQVQPWGTSLDVIVPGEVAGIEVYLGPSSVPAEFAAVQVDQFCGLIVFWTGNG